MKKKTHIEYVTEVAVKNPDIEVIGEYINSYTKIPHFCKIHNIEWDAAPADILRGHKCKQCRIDAIRRVTMKTHSEFVEQLYAINKNIKVIGQYDGCENAILCECLIDGYQWTPTPHDLLIGHGCPVCSEKLQYTTESFIDKMKLINSEIKIIGTYVNNNTPIECECLLDGHIWSPTPHSLLSGKGCPICKESSGERLVRFYLQSKNINFISQCTFDECKNTYLLPFDFYLPDHNICIEYDGRQHYEPVDYFGGIDGFNKTKYRDIIKTNFCNKNSINLLRIKYDEDVNEVLDNFFNNINVIN